MDPKDHLAEKTGRLFLEHGYQVKVLDLVNMKNSDGFNPFRYIETENDLNRILTVYLIIPKALDPVVIHFGMKLL